MGQFDSSNSGKGVMGGERERERERRVEIGGGGGGVSLKVILSIILYIFIFTSNTHFQIFIDMRATKCVRNDASSLILNIYAYH